MTIHAWGFGPQQQCQLDDLSDPRLVAARVIRQDRARYLVASDADPALPARLAGRLRDADPLARPVVGDWVALDPAEPPTIRAVLPRRTQVARQAAGRASAPQVVGANVDVLLVVAGLDGDLNERRLERYLVLARASGAQPVVVLNKADLVADARAIAEAIASSLRVRAIPVSAASGAGFEEIAQLLAAGTTVALVGSSGVGKSSIANRLLGEDVLPTREVRAHDSRGRHSTTARHLLRLPGGALLLDTPGMRELAPWDAEAGLAATFDDVEALAATCRFGDCVHDTEPGCAIRAALASGALDPARWESWVKLRREAARATERQAERRARERAWGRMARDVLRAKDDRRR